VPGTYSVRLTVDGNAVATQEFVVKIDPRLDHVTQADLQARFDLAMQIRDRVSDANEAVILIREVKAAITARREESSDQGLAQAGDALAEALSTVEGEIYQVRNRSNQDPLNFPIKLNNKLAALMGVVEGGEARPTDQSYDVFEYLSGLLQTELSSLHEYLTVDLPAFNDLLEGLGLDPIELTDQG
jgi:hypothetical protein